MRIVIDEFEDREQMRMVVEYFRSAIYEQPPRTVAMLGAESLIVTGLKHADDPMNPSGGVVVASLAYVRAVPR